MRPHDTTAGRPHWRRESIIDVYQLVLGVFLFLSPWLFAYTRSASRIDAWAGGGGVIAVSLAALVAFSQWEEWLNLLLGVCLVAAPWVLGFVHTTAMHISIGVGLVIAYLALLDLWLIHEPEAGAQTSPRSNGR